MNSIKKTDHFYLIDGSGYIFRAYYALPPLSRKSDGLPTGAVSGFCSMLFKLLEESRSDDSDNKPTHFAVIFDSARKNFRNDIYSEYKANRTEAPEDLAPQFEYIRKSVKAFNLPSIELINYEADDLIATYAKKIIEATVRKTLGVSCMFMWIILAALCFGAVFDGIGAVKAIESLFIERWELTPWGVLIMMQLSYILMGMFLDDTAMLVIVAPLYVPLIIALGFDPIWYGILYTITCQIAYMTPPFGYNLFLMRAMAPSEISLADIYRSIIPFVLVMCIGLAIVMAFPEIATWLPDYVSGKR